MASRKLITTFFTWLLITLPAAAAMPPDISKAIRNGDFEAANHLLIPLAETGSADALYQLGRLQQRKLIKNSSGEAAFNYFLQAAELGHIESAYLVAGDFKEGTNTRQDTILAIQWLEKAADQGHKLAIRKLQLANAQMNAPKSGTSYSVETLGKIYTDCDSEKFIAFTDSTDPKNAKVLIMQLPLALHKTIDCKSSLLLTNTIALTGQVNRRDHAGDTALHLAVSHAKPEKIRILVKNKASTEIKNTAGWTPRMLAERSSNSKVRSIFNLNNLKGKSLTQNQLVNAQTTGAYKGWSKLSIASWKGDLPLVQKLVAQGESATSADTSGFTPFYRAIERKELEVLNFFVDSKPKNIDAPSLELLVKLDMQEAFAHLLNTSVNMKLVDKLGLLHKALANNSHNIASHLIKHGANTNKAWNNMTPLITASQKGNIELVSQLLKSKTALNTVDKFGCSALCWAIKNGSREVTLALLNAGASVLPDKNGLTPLMLVAQAGWLECAEKVIANGAVISHQSTSGSHALILASSSGHKNIVALLLRETENVDLPDNSGDTALIAAVRKDHQNVAQQLIASGASIHARNNHFESAKTLALAKSDRSWEDMFDQKTGFWGLVSGGR